jgi:hypothetical protein
MKAAALALLVIWSAPDVARAQAQAPVVASGDVVKVWSESAGLRGLRGTVEAVRVDSFDVRAAGAPTGTQITWASLTRLDVARGHRSKWRGALIWGACLGLAGALIAGSLTSNDADKEATVPLAGWTGFGLGAIIGAHRDTTRWVRVR